MSDAQRPSRRWASKIDHAQETRQDAFATNRQRIMTCALPAGKPSGIETVALDQYRTWLRTFARHNPSEPFAIPVGMPSFRHVPAGLFAAMDQFRLARQEGRA